MSKKPRKKGKRGKLRKRTVPFEERKINIWGDNNNLMQINQIRDDFFDLITEFGALYLHQKTILEYTPKFLSVNL